MSLAASLTDRLVAWRNPAPDRNFSCLRALAATPLYALPLAVAAVESAISLVFAIITSPSAGCRKFFGNRLSSAAFTTLRNLFNILFYNYAATRVPISEAFARSKIPYFFTTEAKKTLCQFFIDAHPNRPGERAPSDVVAQIDPKAYESQHAPLIHVCNVVKSFGITAGNAVENFKGSDVEVIAHYIFYKIFSLAATQLTTAYLVSSPGEVSQVEIERGFYLDLLGYKSFRPFTPEEQAALRAHFANFQAFSPTARNPEPIVGGALDYFRGLPSNPAREILWSACWRFANNSR